MIAINWKCNRCKETFVTNTQAWECEKCKSTDIHAFHITVLESEYYEL